MSREIDEIGTRQPMSVDGAAGCERALEPCHYHHHSWFRARYRGCGNHFRSPHVDTSVSTLPNAGPSVLALNTFPAPTSTAACLLDPHTKFPESEPPSYENALDIPPPEESAFGLKDVQRVFFHFSKQLWIILDFIFSRSSRG